MRNNGIVGLVLLVALLFSACTKDDDSNQAAETANFELTLNGLEDLGDNAQYEGWIIVDGAPVTTGVFSVGADGNASSTSFTVAADDLEKATTFVLTIEPKPDNDAAPSKVHILAGDFTGSDAALTIDHGAALGTDLSNSRGSYLLATPTDGADNNEKSGVWFLDNSSGSPAPGLILDELPEGWVYEGWAVIDGVPVTTGTFSSASGADSASSYSGAEPGPPYPGEDFIVNAPQGLSFPTDLSGGVAVISIEPVPDNSPAPFVLKPLVGMIPADVQDHTVYGLGQNLVVPTGSVKR